MGTGGRAAILISGGLDSPVAAWMMAKRGVELTAVHFASPPYTSELAREKVKRLLQKVAQYAGRVKFITVKLHPSPGGDSGPLPRGPEHRDPPAVHAPGGGPGGQRRELLRPDHRGEPGQVASQTIQAIACTDAVATLPVFRPLIGMDKSEIVKIAYQIDTYDISIEPYEDCCTIFTPKHPAPGPSSTLWRTGSGASTGTPCWRRPCKPWRRSGSIRKEEGIGMETAGRMQLNGQLVRWLRERAAGDFAGELSLVVSYGSHWNGTAGSLSDVDCYFVPKTERGLAFGCQFVLQGVGYDIFPLSWERLRGIARLEESLTPLVGDAQVLYCGDQGDLVRFQALERELCHCLEDSAYCREMAEKRHSRAWEQCGRLETGDLSSRRLAAGLLLMMRRRRWPLPMGRIFTGA